MKTLANAPMQIDHLIFIANLAGEIIRRHFTNFGMLRDVKSDTTPLTIADTEVNDLVIKHVRSRSEEIDIIGEEKNDRKDSPWQIVCDPIDGTFPYTWGMPVATFMIGLLYEYEPVMGVIYDPFLERMYHAVKGDGAWLNRKIPLRVSEISIDNGNPVVGCVSWPGCSYNTLKASLYLEEAGVSVVNFCSIGYMEVAVATGEFAGTVFPGEKYHDTAPGHIIVQEAGGKVSNVFGNPLEYKNGEIEGHIFSNGKIHNLITEAIRSCN